MVAEHTTENWIDGKLLISVLKTTALGDRSEAKCSLNFTQTCSGF